MDEAEDSFGFRTLTWNGKGFFVNGKETLLRGACIHHDNGILGACSYAAAEERRVRLLKEAGFNAIRSAHNPASKALLEACDLLGMYVMDEFCDNWLVHKNPYDYADQEFRTWWERDLTAMVLKNHNHPCVVMNSIGNEISELAIPEGQEMCRKLAVLARALDPDKAVTLGVNLMLCSMTAKGGGIYGDKKDGKENKNGSQTMDNLPTSAFFNLLMNHLGGIIEKVDADIEDIGGGHVGFPVHGASVQQTQIPRRIAYFFLLDHDRGLSAHDVHQLEEIVLVHIGFLEKTALGGGVQAEGTPVHVVGEEIFLRGVNTGRNGKLGKVIPVDGVIAQIVYDGTALLRPDLLDIPKE